MSATIDTGALYRILLRDEIFGISIMGGHLIVCLCQKNAFCSYYTKSIFELYDIRLKDHEYRNSKFVERFGRTFRLLDGGGISYVHN